MRKRLLSKKDLGDIVKNSPYNMHNKRNIVEKYNVSEKTAERRMKDLGLYHTSDRNIECIMRYLNGEKVQDLIVEYSMSQANLNALMRRRGIPVRGTQHFFDFHYFDEIDTEDKAYFLGFIYADGNLHKNSLKISIRDYDEDVLHKLKKHAGANNPVYRIAVRPFDDEDKRTIKERGEMSSLILTHKNIPISLNKHGVVPRKTHKITHIPKTIPKKFMKHFIRGYVDGDGSFGKYKHNDNYYRYSLSIVGTKDFLNNLSEFSESMSGSYFNEELYDRHPETINNIRSLTMSGSENVLNFLHWIYKDSTVYLDRKYERYIDITK